MRTANDIADAVASVEAWGHKYAGDQLRAALRTLWWEASGYEAPHQRAFIERVLGEDSDTIALRQNEARVTHLSSLDEPDL